mgnify:CR=1 FL=1
MLPVDFTPLKIINADLLIRDYDIKDLHHYVQQNQLIVQLFPSTIEGEGQAPAKEKIQTENLNFNRSKLPGRSCSKQLPDPHSVPSVNRYEWFFSLCLRI